MRSIYERASINPVNLVALAITQRTHLTMHGDALGGQVACFRQLARRLHGDAILTSNVESGATLLIR